MLRSLLLLIFVLHQILETPKLLAVNLSEGLKLVRRQNLELAELREQENQATARAQKVLGAYDSELAWTSSHSTDRSKSQTNSYEKLTTTSHELSWQKFTGLGSSIKLGLNYQNTELEFPTPSPPVVISPGIEIDAYNPPDSFSLNPQHQSSLSIEFSQALWRNWLAKELDLQQIILRGSAIPPRYQRFMKEQQIQGETELLFVKLSQLREQERLIQRMTQLSEKFYQLMSKRDTYGRAEQLDVAEAKAQVVKVGGQLLNIKLAIKNIEKQLSFRLYSKSMPQSVSFETFPLTRPAIPLPAATSKKLIQTALEKRFDLAMLSDSVNPLRAQLDLAKEQKSMSVNLFGSATINGLEEEATEAVSELKHPKYTVGLKLAVPLGQNSFRAEEEQVLAGLNEIEHKKSLSIHYIKRDVELAWLALNSADQLYKQAKSHESSLAALLKEERKRISQARSDEIAAIRYRIDILGAKMDAVKALADARESEARIRLICHAYPSERQHETNH
ncbi:MAG: TolC family protein [Oligoflexales bacterium]